MKIKKKSGRQTSYAYIDFFCPQLSVFEGSIIWGQLSQVTQLLGKMWLHPVHIKKFSVVFLLLWNNIPVRFFPQKRIKNSSNLSVFQKIVLHRTIWYLKHKGLRHKNQTLFKNIFCLFQFITNFCKSRMVSKSSLGQILCISYCG